MSLSKKHRAGCLKKRTLSLNEKFKLIDFSKDNPSFGCRKISEVFGVGKTAVANILKNEQKLREKHTSFQDTRFFLFFLKPKN